ncbi:MAG: PLP-dependent aspartate aminotransferase family protein [Proteobacteria bacterium]|nr:PLP-dependent aspartate aminotransferase family protein [Pseudomonadota bacterium]
MKLKTKIIHSGKDIDEFTGASSIPIYQVSTYAQKDPINLGKYDYGRGDNLTRHAVEQVVANLEGGKAGFAFSSGMSAISSVFLLFKPDDEIIITQDVYGGTYRVLNTIFSNWGLKSKYVDMTDLSNIEKSITEKTKAIFVETPTNPLLKIIDLKSVSEIAKKHNLLTIIDNTFMTPYLQRPLEFGFDIVIHSATKFLGGHSDLIAGVVVVKYDELAIKIKRIQNSFGAILGPMDSFLLHRGIKTLAIRMEAQQKTAFELAKWLKEKKGIKRVYYPLLEDHEGRDIHIKQADGGSAVLSFEFDNFDIAYKFMKSVKIPLLGVSLGGVESILSYPASMSHAAMPKEERLKRGISDSLVRLSVGLEDIDDLKEDIDSALKIALNK